MYKKQKPTKIRVEKNFKRYIEEIRNTTSGIDIAEYLKQNSAFINSLQNSKDVCYILDIHTMNYVFLNVKFAYLTGFDTDAVIDNKWVYLEELVLEEDKLKLSVVLKEWYRLLKRFPKVKRKDAQSEFWYRIQTQKKEIINVYQQSEIICLDSKGAPALEFGIIKTNRFNKNSTKVFGTFIMNNKIREINPYQLDERLLPYPVKQVEVAQYVSEGKTIYEIADIKGTNPDNIKKLKQKFVKSIKAEDMPHAISKGKDEGVIK